MELSISNINIKTCIATSKEVLRHLIDISVSTKWWLFFLSFFFYFNCLKLFKLILDTFTSKYHGRNETAVKMIFFL